MRKGSKARRGTNVSFIAETVESLSIKRDLREGELDETTKVWLLEPSQRYGALLKVCDIQVLHVQYDALHNSSKIVCGAMAVWVRSGLISGSRRGNFGDVVVGGTLQDGHR